MGEGPITAQSHTAKSFSNLSGPNNHKAQFSAREQHLLDLTIEHIKVVSRTFQGISDTSVSDDKQKLLLEGEELAAQVADNFRNAVATFLEIFKQEFNSPLQVQELFEKSSEKANEKLIAEGAPLYRTWETEFHPPPDEMSEHLGVFHREFLERRQQFLATLETAEPEALLEAACDFAAWIEKRYNHDIHPLYDGCGRTSKVGAVAVLLLVGKSYPLFEDRESYIELRDKEQQEWAKEFRAALSSSHSPED